MSLRTLFTLGIDETPNQFTFTDVSDAQLNTQTTSATITVTGLSGNIPITITASGGTVDAGTTVLSGTFASSKTVTTSATGTLVIAARITSSGSYSTSVDCIVTINGVSDTFTVTTRAIDTTPNAFSFTDVTNAARSTQYTSNTITISGMDPSVSVTVTASGGTVDAGTSSLSGTYASSKSVTASASGTIVVSARLTSSANFSTAVNCTVTVNGISDTYTVTTLAVPTGEAVYIQTNQAQGGQTSFTWTVPSEVTSICVVAVGPGGNSGPNNYGGGSGGGLGYRNNFTVTPGAQKYIWFIQNSLTVFGSSRLYDGPNNTFTEIIRVFSGVSDINNTSFCAGGTPVSPAVGGAGGVSGYTGGGGGAGGYAGTGGSGQHTGTPAVSAPTAGSGGAGGGGKWGTNDGNGMTSGGGGGVGLYGQGTNGAAGATTGAGGGGGSGGTTGGAAGNSIGGNYGGGAGSAGVGASLAGGKGAIRIMWGPGRSFPSNAT